MDQVVSARRRSGHVFDVRTRSGQSVTVQAGAGAPEAAGPGPMELMLVSLATCAASTTLDVLAAMRRPASDLTVLAFGRRAERIPRVWTDIHLRYHVRGEMPLERLHRAVEVVERTCSASAMLTRVADVTWTAVLVHRSGAEATRPLRRRILRPHQSLEELVVTGEGDERAAWFVAQTSTGEVVGTAGIFPEESPDRPGDEGSWRVRAMAVDDDHRGTGLGAMLLDACLDHATASGAASVWCSARTPATGFYERAGFQAVGGAYDVPVIGPHVRMERPLG